jgi:NAD(P)-dependent dehydrogenase (short-subunit alcohol dehydrogenase family)
MTTTESGIGAGTVLLTGATRGLGRSAVLTMAGRPAADRPDLLLVGRPGADLTRVADEARALGARVHGIGCDLARLSDVRAAAADARALLDAGAVRPLRALVANAGTMSADVRTATADGHELTFAVNYLAHALLIGELLGSLAAPARVVLLGSNVYSANLYRKLMGVPEAKWRDPLELARPATGDKNPGFTASGTAYADAKLALLYYAHELQRRAATGVNVVVFEPGWMPGSALSRGAPAVFQAMGRGLGRLPGVSTPEGSGPKLASVVLDDRWAGLRDGAFVLKDRVTEVRPVAHDRERERRLWEATEQLLADVRPLS